MQKVSPRWGRIPSETSGIPRPEYPSQQPPQPKRFKIIRTKTPPQQSIQRPRFVRLPQSIHQEFDTVIYRSLDQKGLFRKRQESVNIVFRDNDNVIMLGVAGLGWKFGNITICSGKFDANKDSGCLDTFRREMNEEFKITFERERLECYAIVENCNTFLYNCHGLNFAEIRSKVMADHQKARTLFGLMTDSDCRGLKYSHDETPQQSEAAANGEMMDIIFVPMRDLHTIKIAKYMTQIIKTMVSLFETRQNTADGTIVWIK